IMSESQDTSNEDDNNTCILSRLPSEIRWMIFDLLTDSVGEIKLVSKSWRAMIENWIEEWIVPNNLPEPFKIDICEETQGSMNLTVELCKSEAFCFVKLLNFAADISKDSSKEAVKHYSHCTLVTMDLLYADLDRLFPVLSTNVRTVCVRPQQYQDSLYYDGVCDLIKHFRQARILDFSRHAMRDAKSLNLLMKLITNSSIHMIECSVDSFYLSEAQGILIAISEKIDAIAINVANIEGDDLGSGNWVEFVLAMFEKGISIVDIINHRAAVLTPENVRKIVETLISRGKS
ncbi:hypothetical protein PENTCL1PPCAC_12643, partial [Pristionchus entomophagus]